VRVEWTVNPAVGATSPYGFKVQPPFVTVTKPNGSSTIWLRATTQKVVWKSNLGMLENVKIELSLDSGASYPTVVAASTPSDGSFSILVPAAWATTHGRIRIVWLKDGTVVDISNGDFVIQ
jgi:hypothetical protein